MLKTKDKQGQRVTIWPRGKSERPASAGHYQSHVAMLFSRSVETLGTPIELPNEIVMLTGYGARVDEGTGADVVRLLEFEIPAVVCGHGTTDKLPAIYGNPRFDLTAIGFDRARVAATSPGDPTVLLSLCIRLYGDQAARGALNRLALSLQSDAAADGEFITGADPYETIVIEVDLPKADMFVPAEIMLDLEVTEDGIARVARQCCVGDSGEARQVSPVSTKAKLFASAKSAPGVRVQGISVQSMLPSFTSGNHQIYAEIGMIASEPGCGFQGALDFNWFFGEGEASLEDLLHDLRITASLQKMVEAQAVLVRFSPAIPITPVD